MKRIIQDYNAFLEAFFQQSTDEIIADVKGKKLYHTSNSNYRELIKNSKQLIPKQETWGEPNGSDYNRHLGPSVFCNIGEVYDNTYDDDVYEIDTENCPNTFYYDTAIDNKKAVYTKEPIDEIYYKLIYKGTGEGY